MIYLPGLLLYYQPLPRKLVLFSFSVRYSFNNLQVVFKKLYKYPGHLRGSDTFITPLCTGRKRFTFKCVYITRSRGWNNAIKSWMLLKTHAHITGTGGGCINSIALLPKWSKMINSFLLSNVSFRNIRYAIWQLRCSCLLISRFDLPVGIRTVNCIWLFDILVEFYSPLLSWYIPIHWFCMWLQNL